MSKPITKTAVRVHVRNIRRNADYARTAWESGRFAAAERWLASVADETATLRRAIADSYEPRT
jgi:hypothetical protein